MLNDKFTVNSRINEVKCPLDDETFDLARNGELSASGINDYLSKINRFIEKGKSKNHAQYFEALRQQNCLHNFLVIAEDREKQEQKITPKNYFSRGLKLTKEELDEKVTLLIEENNYSESELEGALIYLASETGVYKKDLQQYYLAKKNELETRESDDLTKQAFTRLISLEGKRLDLKEIIPELHASLISDWCHQLDLREEAALTALISGLSSCFDYRTKILGIKRTNFSQHSAIYAALCGESGAGKSILLRKFLYRPLDKFQKQYQEQFKREVKEAERELNEYQACPKEARSNDYPDGKPEVPQYAKRCYLTETTLETFPPLFEAYPGKTILYASDEINKLFKGLNEYKGGQGTDEEKILELYDGGNLTIGRKSVEGNVHLSETGLAIFGGVQPEVLRDIWGDGEDREGKSSRFLYVYQPPSFPKIPLEDVDAVLCPLDEKLEMLFNFVLTSPVTTYGLSDKAYRKFAIFYNHLTDLAKESDRPFLRHVCNKAKGQCLRLILNLHAINSIWQPKFSGIPQQISEDTVDRGIKLTRYYMDQARYLLDSICPDSKLPVDLQTLYNFAKDKKRVSARDVKMSCWKFRNTDSNTIREMFLRLESMGRGTVVGRGNRAKFSTL